MRRVLRRTSFMDRKARDCFSARRPANRATQFGGSHENQRRPGTENVPAIAGMAAAIETTLRDHEEEQKRESILRDRLWEVVSRNAPDARLNGDTAHRLANTLNISFRRNELGDASDGARSGRSLRFKRLGLHGRFGRRVPRPARDGIASSAG